MLTIFSSIFELFHTNQATNPFSNNSILIELPFIIDTKILHLTLDILSHHFLFSKMILFVCVLEKIKMWKKPISVQCVLPYVINLVWVGITRTSFVQNVCYIIIIHFWKWNKKFSRIVSFWLINKCINFRLRVNIFLAIIVWLWNAFK